MKNQFPISNIPLIFTRYRTRILEESGQDWFHPENRLDGVESSPESQDDCITPVSTPVGLASSEAMYEQYEHPDPWESSLPSRPSFASGVNAVSSSPPPTSKPQKNETTTSPAPTPTAIDSSATTASPLNSPVSEAPSQPDTSPSEQTAPPPTSEATQTPTKLASNVNLFPIGSQKANSDVESEIVSRPTWEEEQGSYDLTEFANGEIEAPPVAVRDARQAHFQKVSPPPQPLASDNNFSEPEQGQPPSPKKPPKPPSAEIAKFRLRNCL